MSLKKGLCDPEPRLLVCGHFSPSSCSAIPGTISDCLARFRLEKDRHDGYKNQYFLTLSESVMPNETSMNSDEILPDCCPYSIMANPQITRIFVYP